MDFKSKNISSPGKKDVSNLLRFRNSNLGMSAPSISIAAKDLSIGNKFRNRNISSYQKINYKSTTNISLNLPRPQSPYLIQSPLESPKLPFSNFNILFNPVKKYNTHKNDYRRWSVASLPSSSGYGTTPTSSSFSSKYSSQEKLHQFSNLNRDDNFLSHEDNHINSGLVQNEISLKQRSRSRSLSPTRNINYNPINEISIMNTWYKERFPKATQQMEEKLRKFILENSINDDQLELNSYPVIRFVHHQILELSKDCLHKSETKLITSYYFYEMTDKLEKLIIEAKEKSDNEIEAMNYIVKIVNRLLIIISRPARLLQCLEFDPEEFYHVLQIAEGEARNIQGIKTDIPRYILEKLGLHRQLHCRCSHQRRSRDRTRRTRNCHCNKCMNKRNTDCCDINDDVYWSDNENISCFVCSTPRLQSLTKSVENLKLCDKNSKTMNSPNIHNFEVIKLISNGAYGAVHLVKHKQTRQRFAMKKVNKNHIILRNQVDQVFAERDILSFADNPFVVSMFCSFETKRDLCLVMEYVEGGDCATLLKNIGALPSDIARFYFVETVLAVEYLHNYGIVHRDLKPDNLLITALGHIKLTDFGLSKMGLMSLATNLYEGFIESQEFSDKQVIGTPEYIAPEVILRQGYGKPVDWWSMGIILYEFLTGTVPFFGETPEELFAHTVNDDIEWPEESEEWNIQPEAKSIITALLQHSPRDRLGSGGTHQVKEHVYFLNVDWNSLLRQKAEFIPQLDNDEDTSYFDSRSDRYNHNFENESDDDYNDHSVFSLFSSCSSNYKKVQDLSSYSEKEKVITTQKLKPDAAVLNSTPDLSQTDSDDISPQVQRRKKMSHHKDDISNESSKRTSYEQSKTRGVIKSASISGLSSIVGKNYDDIDNTLLLTVSPTKGEGSSTTSSRDSSPCRELTPLVTNQKPVIDIKKGRKGFGFTIHTIRVYIGDSNFYTMHHLVLNVDEHGSAFKAGLRPGDLITHVNGEPIQGLNHTQVLKLLLGSGNRVNILAAELKHTSIQSGGRKRNPKFSKLAKHRNHKKQTRKEFDKKKKSSLFRKISSKKANVDIQQIAANKGYSQMSMTSSRSFQSFTPKTENINYAHRIPTQQRSNRLSVSSDSPFSSSSSSSSSSSPNVIVDQTSILKQQNYQRPSSLHGLKQKLHPKNLHVTTTPPTQNRRKSVAGHIPVSPLARTPSPSPLPISPTRSPSPLAFSLNTASYQLGSSNSIQLYSPNSITITANKKNFVRNKNSEPSSPLLFRRTISPDRTTFTPNAISTRHNPDLKHSLISPLCSNLTNSGNNKTKHFSNTIWNTGGIDLQESNYELKNDVDLDKRNICCSNKIYDITNESNLENSASECSENLITNNELLPRIAEEKDSPTNSNQNQLSK